MTTARDDIAAFVRRVLSFFVAAENIKRLAIAVDAKCDAIDAADEWIASGGDSLRYRKRLGQRHERRPATAWHRPMA